MKQGSGDSYYKQLYRKARDVYQKGHLDVAKTLFQSVLKEYPNHYQSLYRLGLIYYKKGQYEYALNVTQRAIDLKQKNPHYKLHLCRNLIAVNELGYAEKAAKKVIRIHKYYPEAYYYLGRIYRLKKSYEHAISFLKQALCLKNDYGEVYREIAICFRNLGQEEKAYEYLEKALYFIPDDYESLLYMGVWYKDHDEVENSMAYLERAIEVSPKRTEAHISLSRLYFKLEEYEKGYREYEWKHLLYREQFDKPCWDGEDLLGKTILIHTDNKIGDVIQLARYFQFIKKKGAKILLQCPKTLWNLFDHSFELDGFIERLNPYIQYDYHLPLFSLPKMLDTNKENIPRKTPYLKLPELYCPLPKEKHPGMPKIGFIFQASSNHKIEHYRAIPKELVSHFLDQQPKCNFYSFQYKDGQKIHSTLGNQLIDCRKSMKSLCHTSVLLSQIDLLITVDCSLAHLAGALNIETWLLLTKGADWRWLLDVNYSPWYPSFTVFRQKKLGEWGPVLDEVNQHLSPKLMKKTSQLLTN